MSQKLPFIYGFIFYELIFEMLVRIAPVRNNVQDPFHTYRHNLVAAFDILFSYIFFWVQQSLATTFRKYNKIKTKYFLHWIIEIAIDLKI